MKWLQNFGQDDVEVSVFDCRNRHQDVGQLGKIGSSQFASGLSQTNTAGKGQNAQRNVAAPSISSMTFSSGVVTDEVYINGRQVFKPGDIKFSYAGRCAAKGTILIADDDEGMRDILGEIFSDSYRVFLTTNGFDALRVAQDVRPSLFLLDYHMPGMSGIDLYDRLHAIKEMKSVPAIIMSAYLPKGAIGERQVAFVKKPFDCDNLLYIVEEILTNR